MFLRQRGSTVSIQHRKTPADVHDANRSKKHVWLDLLSAQGSVTVVTEDLIAQTMKTLM